MSYAATRFFSGNFGAENNTLYNVPAGQTAIYTNIIITPTGDLTGYNLYTAPNVWGWGGRIAGTAMPMASETITMLQGFFVAEAGDSLQLQNVAQPASFWMSVHGLLGSGDLGAGQGIPRRFGSFHDTTASRDIIPASAVPSPRKFVIKTLVASNQGAGGNRIYCRVGATPMLPWGMEIAPGGFHHWDGTWVMESGESLYAHTSVAGNVQFYASGVLI